MIPNKEKVIKGLEICYCPPSKCEECPYHDLPVEQSCNDTLCLDAIALLKEREAVEPKTIPDELKLKMWNAFYAEEDKLEEKYVGTKEYNSWFLIYRPWLQYGFDLVIKAIADWEGR